ncbi:hypothetical protein [Streptomyces erythrochromogenes]|uniref:hypothetical protein n=1 Tax=Streptomyces erythrochromogenes TaxID=285574 RepID=UPI0037D7252F
MGRWLQEPFDPTTKTDEEIRQYCLDQIKGQLATVIGGRHSDDALERAARFAAIAQAFRSDKPST